MKSALDLVYFAVALRRLVASPVCSFRGGGGGGVLPYIGYTDMCRWKGYGFQAIWSGIGSRITGSLKKD